MLEHKFGDAPGSSTEIHIEKLNSLENSPANNRHYFRLHSYSAAADGRAGAAALTLRAAGSDPGLKEAKQLRVPLSPTLARNPARVHVRWRPAPSCCRFPAR